MKFFNGVAFAVALLLTGCATPTRSASADELLVVTTVSPLRDMVEQVAGQRATVVGLVPEGVDSHTFEPTPADARVLSGADLFIANGLFLEEPSLALARANLPDGAPVVTLAERTISRDEWVFDRSFPRQGGHPNPHLWLNVGYASDYVSHIADALAEVDPDGADVYERNAAAYRGQLRELDAAIRDAIETIPEKHRTLVTYHDSWAYFGPRYGIAVVAAVQPSDFSEPSAHDVREVIEQIRAADVPAVFGSEVFPSEVLEVIARETGARYVAELADDDIPGEAGDPEHSYIGMMVRNVRTMVEHLGGDARALERVELR